MTRRTISIPTLVDAEFLTKMAARGLRSPSEYLAFLVRQDMPPGHHRPQDLMELHARLDVLEHQQHQIIQVLATTQQTLKTSVSRSIDEGHTISRLVLASLRLARSQEGVEILDPLQEH